MKVLVTESIDREALQILKDRGLEVVEARGLAGEALAVRLREADALIVRSSTEVTASVLDGSRLKVVGRAGVGVNNIDVAAATRLGIAVMNTPTGNIVSAVEHTMALLLSLARNVPGADRSMKEGRWEKSAFMGVELSGKSIGIVGLGRIGSRVATRCRAFGMEVLGFDPYLSPKKAEELGIRLFANLDQLLPLADFVTIHVPLSDDTNRLFDRERIAKMKSGARIVNCSRGGVIDETALLEAIESRRIAGAALDVFEVEPTTRLDLVGRKEIVATPHLGASTVEAQKNVGVSIAVQVADALLDGIYREAVNLPVENWAAYERAKPFLDLAERLGVFAAQFVDGPLESVELEFCGAEFEEKRAILAWALKGLLGRGRDETVNTVNAVLLAEERGLAIGQRVLPDGGLYKQMLRLVVGAQASSHEFGGALFHESLPRLTQIDGYEIEVRPGGAVLIFQNSDRPGVIGAVGSLLGDLGVNIAQFALGRQSPGGKALAALNLDLPLSEDVLGRLTALPFLDWVRQVLFDPMGSPTALTGR